MPYFKITWPQGGVGLEADDIISAMGEFADNYLDGTPMHISSVLIQEVP